MFENYSYGIHHGEFKTGLCSKQKVSLYIRKEGIYGTAATLFENSFYLKGFKIDYKNILKVYVEVIKRLECLVVEYKNTESIVTRNDKFIFPNLTDLNGAIMEIQKEIDNKILATEDPSNVNLIDDLAKQTRGVIVWMGHVGNWEWIAELNRHFADPAMVQYNVYRQLKNPQADKMIIELRGKRGGECVEKNQLLRKLVALRRSPHPYVLGMLSDQKPSKRSSYVWTQFLQQETAFLDGSEVLAKKFGLSAVYAHITSPKRGYYHVRFELITDNAQSMSPEWMTKRYAQLLEQNISAQPEQWLWTHNRWKWSRTDLES